jgi:hypothetical protein
LYAASVMTGRNDDRNRELDDEPPRWFCGEPPDAIRANAEWRWAFGHP